jgi:hypothetical protein
VVASHVIEHVPDLIGWLKETHAVLKPGGILTLAIPDKRYCFDYFRPPTQPADVVDAYLRNQRKPGPRQVFEFYSSTAFWQGHYAWGQDPHFRPEDVVRVRSDAEAWQITSQIVASDAYHDVHCWVFTPNSFSVLVKTLIQINLFDFKVLRFYPPEGCEFYVILEALDLTKDEQERQQVQLESLAEIPLEEAAPSAVFGETQQTNVDRIHLLTNELDRKQNSSAVQIRQGKFLTDELEQEWQRSELLQSKVEELRAVRKRLKGKVEHLQVDLENREREIAAMQSSKFWKLRTGWLRLKQLL